MERNPFQRAQDFLRNKLQPAINPATATPAQQTDIDARNAKKAIEELQRAKTVKQLGQLRQSTIGQGFGYGSMVLGALSGAYNAGKNPYGGMASIVETDLSRAVQAENSKADMKTIREKMIKDAGGIEQYKKLYPAAVEGGYTISPKVRKELAEERETRKPVPETDTPTAPVYNAKERVKTHGVKKAEDMAMMEWAKAHKGLAEKVKPGQAGYDAIQLALGKTTVEPEDIRGFMDDSGKSAEEARAILGGGSVETVIDGDKPFETTINPAPAAQKFAADRVALVSEAMKNAGFQAPTMKSNVMTMEFRDANGNGTDDRFESIPNVGFGAGSGAADFGIDTRLLDRMKEMGLIKGYEDRLYVKD